MLECTEKDMKMTETDIMSIHFNKVSRQNANVGAGPRYITANMDDGGKDVVWRYTINLNIAKNIAVFTMLPRERADGKHQL